MSLFVRFSKENFINFAAFPRNRVIRCTGLKKWTRKKFFS